MSWVTLWKSKKCVQWSLQYFESAQKTRMSWFLLFQLLSRDNEYNWINETKCYSIRLDEFSIWLAPIIIMYLSRIFKLTIAVLSFLSWKCKWAMKNRWIGGTRQASPVTIINGKVKLIWLAWVNFLIGLCWF